MKYAKHNVYTSNYKVSDTEFAILLQRVNGRSWLTLVSTTTEGNSPRSKER